MNSRNDFLNYGVFKISTNFLIRILPKAFTFILISTLLSLLLVAFHAPDALSLDTSFSDDGMSAIGLSTGDDVGSGIAVQSGDKIVVVRTSDDGSGSSDLAVARYLLDLPFNGDDDGGSDGGDSGSG